MASADAAAIAACTTDGTVLATVVSSSYARPLLDLAKSARDVGFRCMLVQPYVDFEALRSPLVRALSLPPVPMLPREQWCGSQRYGWRRAHFYRSRLWRILFDHRVDLLEIDLDWSFHDMRGIALRLERPMAALRAARTKSGHAPDVIALHDGPRRALLNVGLMYVRASDEVRALARRCEQRAPGGWEQGIFNEELAYGSTGLHCCHPRARTACDLRSYVRPLDRIHNLGHEGKEGAKRRHAEGPDRCVRASELPDAPGPPPRSRYVWRPTNDHGEANTSKRAAWAPSRYNFLAKRVLGRCTAMSNVCACPPLPADDEEWRFLNGVRIRHYLERRPEEYNRTVRGRAFRLGLRRTRGDATLADEASGGDEAPVLLREWIGWRSRGRHG